MKTKKSRGGSGPVGGRSGGGVRGLVGGGGWLVGVGGDVGYGDVNQEKKVLHNVHKGFVQ